MAKAQTVTDNPLAVEKETIKHFNITDEVDVTPVQKLGFLQAQREELQAMQWRARVDVIHAKRLQESKNEVLKAKGNNNFAEHYNQVEQFTEALKMINKLIEQLREEYPELKA